MRSSDSIRWPSPMGPGARVALVAPAGPLRGEEDLVRAVDNVRALGWEPMVGRHALARTAYFAGNDAERLADLNHALGNRRVDGIWCLRGGYGAMRLLPKLDLDALRRSPKPVLGYSDITVLHAAIGRCAGVVSFHAPTARGVLSVFSRESLECAVSRAQNPCGFAPASRTLHGGRAEGRLVGGNLALLSSLMGTPYFPSLDGAILVLEDVNEAVYRIDRMLMQLRLSGVLRGLRGLALGAFTGIPDGSEDGIRPLEEVLEELSRETGVPCIADLPVGHIADQWTIPLGAHAVLDADGRRLDVTAPA